MEQIKVQIGNLMNGDVLQQMAPVACRYIQRLCFSYGFNYSLKGTMWPNFMSVNVEKNKDPASNCVKITSTSAIFHVTGGTWHK